jgi:Ca2+-binding RTX toxin-like protein
MRDGQTLEKGLSRVNKDVRSGRRAAVCALAALLIAGALPTSASAASGSVAGGVLTFTGGASVDDITITLATGNYNIADASGIAPTAGAGCMTSAGRLRCDASAITSLVVNLGEGDDKVTNFTFAPAVITGGNGTDQITGGFGADRIDGGDNDDLLNGGWGNDVFVAEPGADAVNGSIGTDTIDYSARTAPVTATLGGAADDGGTVEHDNLTGIERVIGGSGADNLVGTSAAERFVGGLGSDSFDAGGGADVIEAGDGQADSGSCGTEVDTVSFDVLDVFDASCEGWTASGTGSDSSSGSDSSGSDGGGDSGSGDDEGTVFSTPIAVTFGSKPAPFDVRRGTVALALSCAGDAAEGCRGKVTLTITQSVSKGRVAAARRRSTRRSTRRRKAFKIGSRRFKLAPGKEAKVPVRLSRRGRRALGSRRRSKVRATVAMRTTAGKRVETRTVVVERRVSRRSKRKPPRTRGRGRRR